MSMTMFGEGYSATRLAIVEQILTYAHEAVRTAEEALTLFDENGQDTRQVRDPLASRRDEWNDPARRRGLDEELKRESRRHLRIQVAAKAFLYDLVVIFNGFRTLEKQFAELPLIKDAAVQAQTLMRTVVDPEQRNMMEHIPNKLAERGRLPADKVRPLITSTFFDDATYVGSTGMDGRLTALKVDSDTLQVARDAIKILDDAVREIRNTAGS